MDLAKIAAKKIKENKPITLREMCIYLSGNGRCSSLYQSFAYWIKNNTEVKISEATLPMWKTMFDFFVKNAWEDMRNDLDLLNKIRNTIHEDIDQFFAS